MHPYGGAIPLPFPYTGYWITPGICEVDGPRIFSYKVNGGNGARSKRWYELRNRSYSNSGRYPHVYLSGVNQKSIDKRHPQLANLQRLVCLVMLGPCPEGMEVRHLDQRPEFKRDPSFFMLDGSPRMEYNTHLVNCADMVKCEGMRTYPRAVRERAMLLRAQGVKLGLICAEIGCAYSTICKWIRELS